MVFRLILNFLIDLRFLVSWGFWPTVQNIAQQPTLLLHPIALRQTFFSHVWAVFSKHLDEGGREEKRKLITPHAYGVCLDVGAGSLTGS